MKFLFENKIISQKENGDIEPIARKMLYGNTELEIVTAYNAELRGLCNYYSLACNFGKLSYFAYLMEYSCLKTLAAKHKSSISKIKSRYKDGKGEWGILYKTKDGEKHRYFAKFRECQKNQNSSDIIPNAVIIHRRSRTTLESRLKAKKCELCGDTETKQYEVHHVHKVKDLKGKEKWEQAMIAKRRKTLVLCKECHNNIHYQK
jgi:hypothetical protein